MSKSFDITKLLNDLSNTKITEPALRYRIYKPEHIDLLAESLKSANHITGLTLEGCSLKDPQIIKIIQALPKNTQIINMNLSSNLMEDAGLVELANYLRTNRSIKKIKLDFAKVTTTGLKTFFEALLQNDIVTDISLKAVNIAFNQLPSFTEYLKNTTSLKALRLGNSRPSTQEYKFFAEALALNKTIEVLDLSGMSIDAESCRYLAAAFAKNSKILNINFIYTALTDEGLIFLSEGIAKNTSIERLYFTLWQNIQDSSFNQLTNSLAASKTLKQIHFGLINSLSKCKNVAYLIENTESIDYLDLQFARFSNDDGVKAIAKSLRKNTTISTLHVGSNTLGSELGAYLLKKLIGNQTISSLLISENDLNDDALPFINKLLQQNKALTNLDISYNRFSEQNAKFLAEGLAQNTSLTHINIAGNGFGDKGIKIICEALLKNTTLTSFDMHETPVQTLGAQAIAALLENSYSLQTLSLRSCYITNKPLLIILNSLKTNKKLKYLDLSCNNDLKSLAKELKENVRKHPTILAIHGLETQDAQLEALFAFNKIRNKREYAECLIAIGEKIKKNKKLDLGEISFIFTTHLVMPHKFKYLADPDVMADDPAGIIQSSRKPYSINTSFQIKSDESFKSETEGVYKQVHDRDRILKKGEGSFKNGNWYNTITKLEQLYQSQVAIIEEENPKLAINLKTLMGIIFSNSYVTTQWQAENLIHQLPKEIMAEINKYLPGKISDMQKEETKNLRKNSPNKRKIETKQTGHEEGESTRDNTISQIKSPRSDTDQGFSPETLIRIMHLSTQKNTLPEK